MTQMLLTVAGLTIAGLLSPGPNFVLITGRALSSGRRAALATAGGVSLGSTTHAVLGIAGLGALLASTAWLFTIAKLVGASYLLWIGAKSLRSAIQTWCSSKSTRSDPPSAHPGLPVLNEPMALRRSFVDGYLTQMSNPKSTLFFLAMFTTVVPTDASIVDGIAVVSVISALAVFGYLLIAVVFSQSGIRRAYRRVGFWFDGVFGALMIALGLRVAVAER